MTVADAIAFSSAFKYIYKLVISTLTFNVACSCALSLKVSNACLNGKYDMN